MTSSRMWAAPRAVTGGCVALAAAAMSLAAAPALAQQQSGPYGAEEYRGTMRQREMQVGRASQQQMGQPRYDDRFGESWDQPRYRTQQPQQRYGRGWDDQQQWSGQEQTRRQQFDDRWDESRSTQQPQPYGRQPARQYGQQQFERGWDDQQHWDRQDQMRRQQFDDRWDSGRTGQQQSGRQQFEPRRGGQWDDQQWEDQWDQQQFRQQPMRQQRTYQQQGQGFDDSWGQERYQQPGRQFDQGWERQQQQYRQQWQQPGQQQFRPREGQQFDPRWDDQQQFRQDQYQQDRFRQQPGRQQRPDMMQEDEYYGTGPGPQGRGGMGGQSVRGEIRNLDTIQLANVRDRHVIATIQTEDGERKLVDLGPERGLRELDLDEGSKVSLSGMDGFINDRPVLMAMQIQSDEGSARIDRTAGIEQASRFDGRVIEVWDDTVLETNRQHQFALVQLDRGGMAVVDLGPTQQLRRVNIRQGREISLLGRPVMIDGERALLAHAVAVDGSAVNISRADQQSQLQTQGGIQNVGMRGQPMQPRQRMQQRDLDDDSMWYDDDMELDDDDMEFDDDDREFDDDLD